MSSIQQFYQLPGNIQREVLDFMSYVAEKNGVKLKEDDIEASPHVQKWSAKVPVCKNTGEPISATVRKMRDEEKW
ncbi:MAG: DUF2281 domain-containing protein [Spirochaetales bacterium]|nr:DUF2281 domain-containing protein [Spirochaetales bacterium]